MKDHEKRFETVFEEMGYSVPTIWYNDENPNDVTTMFGLCRKMKDDYEGWLKHLKWQSSVKLDEEHVPALTYFLVRESDHRIVGMINIRTALNERLSKLLQKEKFRQTFCF